jgi:hypothetical protein
MYSTSCYKERLNFENTLYNAYNYYKHFGHCSLFSHDLNPTENIDNSNPTENIDNSVKLPDGILK